MMPLGAFCSVFPLVALSSDKLEWSSRLVGAAAAGGGGEGGRALIWYWHHDYARARLLGGVAVCVDGLELTWSIIVQC
jgi:hypothetical protein